MAPALSWIAAQDCACSGNRLAAAAGDKTIDAHILVTHYHWDHIQGMPFFAPLYSPKNRFHFYSFRSEFLGHDSLKRVFAAQMATPYFPVNLSAMSAARDFTEVGGGDQFTVGETRVKTQWLNHPQGCLGFRIRNRSGNNRLRHRQRARPFGIR